MLKTIARSRPTGRLTVAPVYGDPLQKRELHYSLWSEFLRFGFPRETLCKEVREWRWSVLPANLKGILRLIAIQKLGIPFFYGKLSTAVWRGKSQIWVPYGLASVRVVTTVGVNFLVDCLQGTFEPELLRFHALGEDATAEAVGNNSLGAEISTQYNPNDTRATGSLTEGASANIFRSVGTNTLDSGTATIEEFGLFTQAATGGGVLLDRALTGTHDLNGANGDGMQTQYDFTITAGG